MLSVTTCSFVWVRPGSKQGRMRIMWNLCITSGQIDTQTKRGQWILTLEGDCPNFCSNLVLISRKHTMILCAIRHASNADEHETRSHDEHSRNNYDRPAPAVHDYGQYQACSDGAKEKSCYYREYEAPIHGCLVWDRYGRKPRHLQSEFFRIVTTNSMSVHCDKQISLELTSFQSRS